MGRDFYLQFRHSEGNLHVRAQGEFDADAAQELLELLQAEYHAGDRVFVDTAGLGAIHPSGRGMLDTGMEHTAVPLPSLFFKGEKGFQVAPSGSRVLIVSREKKGETAGRKPAFAPKPKKHCCGTCAHCTCGHEHAGEKREGATFYLWNGARHPSPGCPGGDA